ncbi:hypothetical protein DL764_007099 [Monosporascus ibericus]|uniref:Uncharacterized protein n=1 Tax=Monosporascus ibericus TaxID=155417 RepID=A0A4Q4T508_9PEZI|nr:hypothetical protein DL764_007099 [Monosporascus ibericus]
MVFAERRIGTHEHIETAPQVFNPPGYQTGILGKERVGPREVYRAAETGRLFHLTVELQEPHRGETHEGFGNDEDGVREVSLPNYKAADVELPAFISHVPELRTELVECYRSISRMDLDVGLILAELAKRGLAKNTLVIFINDNNSPFLNSKTGLYYAGVRLLLLVRQPGGKSGVLSPNMYKYHWNTAWRLDFPFATDLYGSLSREHIRNAAPTDQSDTPEVILGRRRLRNHVYCRPEELFDLETTLSRWTTWRASPSSRRWEVRTELEDWQYETDDPWLFRDGVSAITTRAAQKLGMRLPDRFDFEPKNPGSSTGPHWARPSAKNSPGLMEFGCVGVFLVVR